ncbi:unnamed protein product [Bursaphelenchus xylophilus]|uniref:(pine wood nematode) hypothetical protein n=1 Tax=Bursaphelenchus xylophilus TaxID=6326 RepID=A0A7I8WFQ4_BURXY|nr:unnamed protein product [Bursaphelenchus xylophilus]CAG9111932.1 unnamed protein product [Bursaphelenchus xylophilus]
MRVAYSRAPDATRSSASSSSSTLTSFLSKSSERPYRTITVIILLLTVLLSLGVLLGLFDSFILAMFQPNFESDDEIRFERVLEPNDIKFTDDLLHLGHLPFQRVIASAPVTGQFPISTTTDPISSQTPSQPEMITSTPKLSEKSTKIQRNFTFKATFTTKSSAKLENLPKPVWRKTPEELASELLATTDLEVINQAFEEIRSGEKQVWSAQNNTFPPIIVTALFDIGRGDWIQFTRPFDLYLESLNHLIRMPNPIVIFGDEKVAQYIKIYPEEIQRRIQMVTMRLKDLPFYGHRREIAEILQNEQENWDEKWPSRFRTHPEAWSADYNIVVNSKSYFMYKATLISKFKSNFFAWIDAGYSHGERDKIPRWTWRPKLPHGKITLIQVSPPTEKIEKYELSKVYRQTRDVISGGVLAGDTPTIKRFHVFFLKTFVELLDAGKVDDDQTTLLFTIKNYRSTFNILHGGWLDAFKVIPREPFQRQRKRFANRLL